ncbi:hypothetical protein Rmet_6731 (plasmid) [Cupriavidus metallidurans CH34]|uniref:Uncharacterized protein n=1 Tax=Cupriavidus metallidurans (strain ATCC 43123 / DSM 2839 / NBRC 102507 / CH34) TaxID=266264 RepID=D3DYE0_CUPMC|nr:hypothetical protein Rmet_6731 [Cupriavidus metallidurans CH34]
MTPNSILDRVDPLRQADLARRKIERSTSFTTECYVGLAGPLRDTALSEAFLIGWERIRSVAARSRSAPSEGRIVLTSRDFTVSDVAGRVGGS